MHETVLDHNPTPEELESLCIDDIEEYKEAYKDETDYINIAYLYAERGDKKTRDAYVEAMPGEALPGTPKWDLESSFYKWDNGLK